MKTRLEAWLQNSGGYPDKVTTSSSKILLKEMSMQLSYKEYFAIVVC